MKNIKRFNIKNEENIRSMSNLIINVTLNVIAILIFVLCNHSVCRSASETDLIMKDIRFTVEENDYLVKFTAEIYNGCELPIEHINATVIFEDKKGNLLAKVHIKPNFQISPNESSEETWTYLMNPFCPMLKMKKEDIEARLLVREITFSTGEKVSFNSKRRVVY